MNFKKFTLSCALGLILAILIGGASKPAASKTDWTVQVDSLVALIMKHNDKIADRDTVEIGVIIRIPLADSSYFFATVPEYTNHEKLGCLWSMAARFYHGTLPRRNEPTGADLANAAWTVAGASEMLAVEKIEAETNETSTNSLWKLVQYLTLIALLVGLWILLRHTILNPDHYAPVIEENSGLDNAAITARVEDLMSRGHLTGQLRKISKGKIFSFVRIFAPFTPFKMRFGDGVERVVTLRNGMECLEIVMRENGKDRTHYVRSSCMNLFGPLLVRGEFTLPNGWVFRPTGVVFEAKDEPAASNDQAVSGDQSGQTVDDSVVANAPTAANGEPAVSALIKTTVRRTKNGIIVGSATQPTAIVVEGDDFKVTF